LKRIATASPPYRALIDTGALITGFSNIQVAEKLLEYGLPWCNGIVFLDEEDRKQVLVRGTGRVVAHNQCGVPLEKRFAFYDQIHTTGTDINHTVNATAVLTLGKDMVFRDYVQGAFRMRQIGKGQKICVFVIPEVAELMERVSDIGNYLKKDEKQQIEFDRAIKKKEEYPLDIVREKEVMNKGDPTAILWDIVAWLIINSLKSEETQWAMLCIQNISNIYRKKCL
jgi:hypothetical protein